MAKYYYNGVLLPELPVVDGYSYAWIRKNTSSGYYDLIFTALRPYFYSNNSIAFGTGVSAATKWYRIQIASADSAEEWTLYSTDTTYFGLDSARTVLWSNTDIPVGSISATDIYFFATELVEENSPDQLMEYAQSTAAQYINTGIIPDSTTEIEMKYSAQSYGTYGSHMLSCASFYFPFPRNYGGTPHFFYSRRGSEARVEVQPVFNTPYTVRAFPGEKVIIDGTEYSAVSDGGKDITKTLYLFTYGGDPGNAAYTGKVRIYYCKIWQNSSLVRDFVPMWSAGTVGMYDKVERKFYTSEGTAAFIAGPMLGPMYDRKYLIRSASTLYTVTDNDLTALTETEVTASLFQTYGVDDLPDGSLLLGLTDLKILYWQDSDDALPTITATVKGSPPVPQVVVTEAFDMSDSTILGIESATVDASDDVLWAVSFDDGATWKAYDGTQWAALDQENSGMNKETFEAIDVESWAAVVSGDHYRIRFVLPDTASYVASLTIHYLNEEV